MNRLSRHQNGSCFLIKTVRHLSQIFSSWHDSLYSCNSESFLSINMLISRLELKMHLLLGGLCLCSYYVKIHCETFCLVHPTKIPLICTTNTNFSLWHVCSVILVLNRGTLTDHSTYLEFLTTKELSCSKETHFELTLLIYFKELSETLFEYRVPKWISHNVKSASHFKTSFHFYNTDLV